MSFVSLSGFLITLGLASASRPPQDVCFSSPLRLSECRQLSFEERNNFAQAPLGHATLNRSSSSPWKFQGGCTTTKGTTSSFCIYSSHAFADGRGVSILTTPERAESFLRLPAFVEPGVLSDRNTQPSPPPFEERELPGRGRGLIANRTLHRGDRIFAHTPILILDEIAYDALDARECNELEKTAVKLLPPRAKKIFWELYGQPVLDPVNDRINTNAFELEIDGMSYYGVIPEVARINHDCRPNAAYFFDEQTLTHYVHAITTINPGTEITVTYIDPHMLRRQRLDRLYSSWGFNCSCSLCSLHPSLADASDARLVQMEDLIDVLQESSTASPQIAEMLINLYQQERLYAPLSSAYRFAALTFCAHGHRWNTIRYAHLAIEHVILDEGFRHKDVRLMELLAEQPERQSCCRTE